MSLSTRRPASRQDASPSGRGEGSLHERAGTEGPPPGFLELPPIVYRDDPNWVPEDPAAVAAAFSADNSYFQRGEARLFCIPGKVRAAAFHEPGFLIAGQPVAYFGFFESTGDGDANAQVMAHIEGWAQERGARVLYGPIQFNTMNGYRLRLSVEPGGLPFLGEPYNPDSYPAMLEALGLRSHLRYVTQLVPFEGVRKMMELARPSMEALLSAGYRFEVPSLANWSRSIPDLYEMVDNIFSQNFAYSKVSYPDFQQVFEPSLLRRACQRCSSFAFGPDGNAVAIALGYPHYGPLIVQGGQGRQARVPVRDLDYAIHAPLLQERPRGCIGKMVGVHPAHRRKGLMESLFLHCFEQVSDRYDLWYAAMVREDNPSRLFFSNVLVGERVYALYRKELGDPAEAQAAPTPAAPTASGAGS